MGPKSATLAAGMMKFSNKPIHSNLTTLGGSVSPDLKKRAVFLHKCILVFAGDSTAADAGDPDFAASSLLNTALVGFRPLLLILTGPPRPPGADAHSHSRPMNAPK